MNAKKIEKWIPGEFCFLPGMEEPFFWCELGEIIAVDKIKIIAADMHSEDALDEV